MHTKINTVNSKPEIISIMNTQLVSFAEPLAEYLEQIKEKKGVIAQLPIPDLDDWLDIYKKPSRLKKMFRSLILSIPTLCANISETLSLQ